MIILRTVKNPPTSGNNKRQKDHLKLGIPRGGDGGGWTNQCHQVMSDPFRERLSTTAQNSSAARVYPSQFFHGHDDVRERERD
jgi:hypothetical protein